jgi:peptidoglycan/xylan/chitin deacetylase (PgdA/CDA1 family)
VFRKQIQDVQRKFHLIGVPEITGWYEGREFPKHPALITFDDGLRNNVTHAAPVLTELGIPAMFGVCPGYLGQPRLLWPFETYRRLLYWPRPTIPIPGGEELPIDAACAQRTHVGHRICEQCKRIPAQQCGEYLEKLRQYDMPELTLAEHDRFDFMSWSDVGKLRSLGFEIASHTSDHCILTQLQPQQLAHELEHSKAAIEHNTGSECSCFVYPNGGHGDVSKEVVNAVRNAGYRFAFTLMDRYSRRTQDPLLLDRVYISGNLSGAALHIRTAGLHGIVKRHLAAVSG